MHILFLNSFKLYNRRGFVPSKAQTSLLSYRDLQECLNFARSLFSFYKLLIANNEVADQTARVLFAYNKVRFPLIEAQIKLITK